ncbi:S41 family peptidase [bacterium]|nr:MAG: S41 family peptidase [bacterium]QQR61900.1 MAG: S41 family peptidase [bacterium]
MSHSFFRKNKSFLLLFFSYVYPEQNNLYDEKLFDWTHTWAQVTHLVKEKHYDPQHLEKALNKAVDTFLNTLDPHSNFLDQKTYKSMIESTSGEFHGIGIIINNTRKPKEKFLTILDTLTDGPAEKSGIKQYDKIVEIGGTSLEGLTTEEATTLLKGPKGTTVTLKVLREGLTELLTFTITRDIIKEQQSLCFYLKQQHMYYLSLSMFAENSVTQLEQLLTAINKNNQKGLILDLRNNSGGLLTSAIDIAGLFLDKGSTVVSTKNAKNAVETYQTSRDPIAQRTVPIVVLINNYTASAAEILAGCLKAHADKSHKNNPLLIFIVGTPSFGKGSVQEVIPIGQNSAIKLTTALYFLPFDIPVQGIGILPDIFVERQSPPSEQMAWLTQNYGHESSLENYIKLPEQKKKNAEKKKEKEENNKSSVEKETKTQRWQERVQQILEHDNQLKEAINILSLVINAQKNMPDFIKNRTTALAYVRQNYIADKLLETVEIPLK